MSSSFTCFLFLLLLAFSCVLASANSANNYNAHNNNGGEDQKYSSSSSPPEIEDKKYSSSSPEGGDDNKYSSSSPEGGDDNKYSSSSPEGGEDKKYSYPSAPKGGEDNKYSSPSAPEAGEDNKYSSSSAPEGGEDKKYNSSAPEGGEDQKYSSSSPEGDDDKEYYSSSPAAGGDNGGDDAGDDDVFTLEAPNLDEITLDNQLSFGHYRKTCAQFESIVHRKVNEWVKKDPTLGASIMRLHFHDCFVRGCDASILLNHEASERRANASKTLRGFDVINDIKAELEKHCPKTVSCADILTAATRDATVALGGPYWVLPYGRKDGRISIADEADTVPMGREDTTSLLELFQSKGLNVLDLVVLSGAHTIGRASCGSIQDRIFNYKHTGKPDPSIDPKYLDFLQRKCRWASEYVHLDASTPTTFDPVYYLNLHKNMALLSTDQMLFSDSRTSQLVSALIGSNSQLFNHQFAVSMAKLGNVGVLTNEDEGEIRTNCNSVNNNAY